MAKPKISEVAYVAELNERLKEHPDFREGMAFYIHPEGAVGRAILGVATRGFAWNKAYMETNSSVQNEFDVEITNDFPNSVAR